jgi:hypothetical protein
VLRVRFPEVVAGSEKRRWSGRRDHVDGRLSTAIQDVRRKEADYSKPLQYEVSKEVTKLKVIISNMCPLSS